MLKSILTIAVLAAITLPASNAEAGKKKKRPTTEEPEKKLLIGAATGYAIPGGDLQLSANGDATYPMSDYVERVIPLSLEVGYKVTSRFVIGAYYTHGFVTWEEDAMSDNSESYNYSGNMKGYGIHSELFFADSGNGAWIGLSAGQESLNQTATSTSKDSEYESTGSNVAMPTIEARVGYEIGAGDFKVSPFVSYSRSTYSKNSYNDTDEFGNKASGDEDIDDERKSPHNWITIGVRGYIGVL